MALNVEEPTIQLPLHLADSAGSRMTSMLLVDAELSRIVQRPVRLLRVSRGVSKSVSEPVGRIILSELRIDRRSITS